MTTFHIDPTREHPVLLKAQAVHGRLGDAFYSIYRIADFELERGLLIDWNFAHKTSTALTNTGYRLGQDFGIGYGRRCNEFVPCHGIHYAIEADGMWFEVARSELAWSEDLLPSAVRESFYQDRTALQQARTVLFEAQRAAECALRARELEASCLAAHLEQIPERVIAWASRQESALTELSFIRHSVSLLRSRHVPEAVIQDALNHSCFSQELIRLTRSTGSA